MSHGPCKIVHVTVPFADRVRHVLTAVEGGREAICVLLRRGRATETQEFTTDLFMADGVGDDPETWTQLATALDNLADFARREAFKRRKT